MEISTFLSVPLHTRLIVGGGERGGRRVEWMNGDHPMEWKIRFA